MGGKKSLPLNYIYVDLMIAEKLLPIQFCFEPEEEALLN